MISDFDKKYLGNHLSSVLESLFKVEADLINGRPLSQNKLMEETQKIHEVYNLVEKDPGYDPGRKKLFLFEVENIKIRIAKIILGVDISKLKGAGFTPMLHPQFRVHISWEAKRLPDDTMRPDEEPERSNGWLVLTESPTRKKYIPMAKVTSVTVERL